MPTYTVEQKRDLADQMRKQPTLAERALWRRLRKKQTGFVFHRQSLQRGYILDFYCPRLRVAIEVDGSVHLLVDQSAWDAAKETALSEVGIKVLRFTNQDVLDFPTVVMARIETTLKALSGASPDGKRRPSSRSSSRPENVSDMPVAASPNDWRGLRATLNRFENLCRPQEIPEEMRITREGAEQIVAASKKLLTNMRNRSLVMQEDTRTTRERAINQQHQFFWYLKTKRPDLAKKLVGSEPQSLTLRGMHVVEKKQA